MREVSQGWWIAHIVTLILFIVIFAVILLQQAYDYIRTPTSMLARYLHPLCFIGGLEMMIRLIDPVGVHGIVPFQVDVFFAYDVCAILATGWLVEVAVNVGVVLTSHGFTEKAKFERIWRKTVFYLGVAVHIVAIIFATIAAVTNRKWALVGYLAFLLLYCVIALILTSFVFRLLWRVVITNIKTVGQIASSKEQQNREKARKRVIQIISSFYLTMILIFIALSIFLSEKSLYSSSHPYVLSNPNHFNPRDISLVWVQVGVLAAFSWIAWLPLHTGSYPSAPKSKSHNSQLSHHSSSHHPVSPSLPSSSPSLHSQQHPNPSIMTSITLTNPRSTSASSAVLAQDGAEMTTLSLSGEAVGVISGVGDSRDFLLPVPADGAGESVREFSMGDSRRNDPLLSESNGRFTTVSGRSDPESGPESGPEPPDHEPDDSGRPDHDQSQSRSSRGEGNGRIEIGGGRVQERDRATSSSRKLSPLSDPDDLFVV